MDMGNMLDSLLEATGGNEDIKQAIDAKDLAGTVRAATEALKKSHSIPMRLAERKSAEESNKFRKEGNLHYLKSNHKEALINFNKALAYAPNNSSELKLAYSNISAVMFSIKEYKDCQIICNAALNSNCPAFLKDKLEKRMKDASKLINPNENSIIKYGGTVSKTDEVDMLKYAKFDVERNVDIPCASTDVSVDNCKIVAAKEIESGTMVALERAFVSVQDSFEEYTTCYYCHKICFFLIPCEGCCKALFCSNECSKKCLEEYHRIECHIVAYMGSMYKREINKLAIRAAIKMSLKLSWEELRIASLEMGKKNLQKSSIAEAFNNNNPISLLYYDDEITVPNDKIKNASLICAAAIHCLEKVPDYLPEEEEEREKAKDSLSRIILHLNTTFIRKVYITSSAIDVALETYRCGAQRNEGWFSFASKLAHSCEPNLQVLGLNDRVALVAIQRIKKGEPLTISYVMDHFYELNITPFGGPVPKNLRVRQKQILDHLHFTCNCRVCIQGWHGSSQVKMTLTGRQELAYGRCMGAMICGSFAQKMKAIGESLDELTGCNNKVQHYNSYGSLRQTLNTWQCVVARNVVYKGVSRYFFE